MSDGEAAGGRAPLWQYCQVAVLRCNPVIRQFTKRLEDEGKLFKVVIIACMRKLLVIINTMVKTNTHWNPKFT